MMHSNSLFTPDQGTSRTLGQRPRPTREIRTEKYSVDREQKEERTGRNSWAQDRRYLREHRKLFRSTRRT